MQITLRSPFKITRNTEEGSITIEVVQSRVPKKERPESFAMRLKKRALTNAEATVAKLKEELRKEMQP